MLKKPRKNSRFDSRFPIDMKMTSNLKQSLLSLGGMSLLAVPASAALLIHEPFDYAPTAGVNNGSFLGDGNQGGGLGLGAYTQTNSGSNEIDVADGGLVFGSLPTSGNSFERAQRVGQAAVNAPITVTGLATEGTTTWMTFLYQDRGFSGPDFAIALTSQTMAFGDPQALSSAGFGVGVGINSIGGPARAIGAALYNNSTGQSFTPEGTASFNGPGGNAAINNDVYLLGMKINWNAGADDELFVFDLSGDFSTEPAEGSAIASTTFNWTQAEQNLLNNLAINESQVNFLDEIRVATTFDEAVGGGAIPEPSSAILMSLGGLALLCRRRS